MTPCALLPPRPFLPLPWKAGVWLKHAECLHSLNQLESAAVSYAQVVALAPHHTNAKLTLATIYGQLGRTDDALAVLGELR